MASYIHTDNGYFVGKLDRGDDLLEALTDVARENGIRLGQVKAIGALEKACIAYYDQTTKTYNYLDLSGGHEILNLTGNISRKDGEPMVHAHVTLSDEEGRAFGGHLGKGSVVFACEFWIQPWIGPDLVRGFDEDTGLPLWEFQEPE